MSNLDSPSSAILRTLIYASIFDSGLSSVDLMRLLISPRRFTQIQVENALIVLEAKHVIIRKMNLIRLAKRSSFNEMRQRSQESEVKLKLLDLYLPLINWIPSIYGIAVTGSVAINNATPDDDVDLMIVVRRGFLWSTRALVQGILLVRGVLRTRGATKFQNKLCLNLWLDESGLKLHSQTLYVARELVQAVWVLDRRHIRERLRVANDWVSTYLSKPSLSFYKLGQEPRVSINLVSQLFAPVESLAFLLETARMRSRTREIVMRNQAFFHPRDTQGDVLKKYLKLCACFGVDSLVR